MRAILAGLLMLTLAACAPPAPAARYDVEEKTIAQLQADMAAGVVTSEQLVEAYLARIEAMDRQAGARLNSIIALNPEALAQARALDAERAAGRVRGPLHGVPILIKDNIETAENTTTAGSLALAENRTGRDAPLITRLREAGAIILGKTNLSEWANIRSSDSISGWSAVGGLTRNPYALNRNACGSSSGSGVAAASSFAAAAIGTETDGSIVCPAAVNGLVGIKPTVGLVSRRFVVPISHSQDTAGPMARTVADAAAVLTVLAGTDPEDAATAEADARRQDYTAALNADALRGRRIGVVRPMAGFDARVDDQFEAALQHMRDAGAELVEIRALPPGLERMDDDEFAVLLAELRIDLNAYLATTPQTVRTRTLADVIAFNAATPDELALFGQDLFTQAEATRDDAAYRQARERSLRAAGRDGIDRMLREHRVEALVAPTTGPAWTIDVVSGDHYSGGSASSMPAIAGYPHITAPMGLVHGLPVGISFFAEAWSESRLIGFAYAFEQRANARVRPTYAQGMEGNSPVARALLPADFEGAESN